MYQPLLELPSGAAAACVSGERLLGEAVGTLYGSSRRTAFETQGGAVYPVWGATNRNVLSHRSRCVASSLSSATLFSFLWRWWGQGAVIAKKLLAPLVSLMPLLRLIFPFVVPPSADRAPHLLGGSDYPERVRAIAFHPYCMLLAAAVDEGAGSSRVVVYDVAEGQETCILTHAFQRHTRCLAWKPFSRDVLAVGCDGGVLLWSLFFGTSSSVPMYGSNCNGNGINSSAFTKNNQDGVESVAHCLFYRCTPHIVTTCVSFSCRDGRYLACGSTEHVAVHFHDLRLTPRTSLLLRSVSVEGATEDLIFADDDTFVVRLVCGASTLVLTTFPSCASVVVPTAAPVLKMVKARALGPNHFFMHCARVEGVFMVQVNQYVGVQVIALISTGICGGIGGGVRRIACSGRRLYIALETGHLLVCHYGRCRGISTLIPVGVAELDVAHMTVFDGCVHGSLLAAVEASDQTLTFVPSYHS